MPDDTQYTEESIYSYEVTDILTQIPHWLIRWGITVIFFTVMALFMMTWFIKYPDVIHGRITLNTANAPAPVVCRSSGALHLFLSDKANVIAGDMIAYIQNTASYTDITALKTALATIDPAYPSGIARLSVQGWQLGELQPYLNDLIGSIKKQQLSGTSGTANSVKQQFIEKQISEYKSMSDKLNQQLKSRQDMLYTARNNYNNRYLTLFQQGAISKVELEQQERELQQKENEVREISNSIDQNNSQILALQREIAELNFSQTDNLSDVKSLSSDAYYLLKSQISIWEDRYLLKAPVSGTLNYTQFTKENTFIRAEQEIASIIPKDGNRDVYGELFISQSGAGKVHDGQTVQIELDSYPKKEFGLILGTVTTISDVSTDSLYKIQVGLPNKLQTTTHKTLNFKYGMQGTASIITKNMRLIERFFNELRQAFE